MTQRGSKAPQTGPRAKGSRSTGAATAAAKKKQADAEKAARDARERAMNTKLQVDGVGYRLGDLTLGEIEALEEHTSLPMDLISYNSAKVIAFVVYLVKRRSDPEYTPDDARGIQIDKLSPSTVDDDGDPVVAAVGDNPPT